MRGFGVGNYGRGLFQGGNLSDVSAAVRGESSAFLQTWANRSARATTPPGQGAAQATTSVEKSPTALGLGVSEAASVSEKDIAAYVRGAEGSLGTVVVDTLLDAVLRADSSSSMTVVTGRLIHSDTWFGAGETEGRVTSETLSALFARGYSGAETKVSSYLERRPAVLAVEESETQVCAKVDKSSSAGGKDISFAWVGVRLAWEGVEPPGADWALSPFTETEWASSPFTETEWM